VSNYRKESQSSRPVFLTQSGAAKLQQKLVESFSTWIAKELISYPVALGSDVEIEYSANFYVPKNIDPNDPSIKRINDSEDVPIQ